MEREKLLEDFKRIKDEYAPKSKGDIFFEGDSLPEELKRIVYERLDIVERTFILLYAEYGTFTAIARILGVTHPSVSKEIHRIQAKVRTIYEQEMKRKLKR